MFTALTDEVKSQKIATAAFRMGINCPDIRQAVYSGTPEDANIGRARRDGNQALAIFNET